MITTTTTQASRRRETGKGQARDLNVREGQEGRGVGAKKTFLNWFPSFIRSHGKETQNKSFFVSL